MRISGTVAVLLFFATILIVAEQSDAWWGRSRSSSRSSRRTSTWQKAKNYVSGFKNGAESMHKAYGDMREANYKHSDKYFHARGNSDAAKFGTGGRHAAKIISEAREIYGFLKGDSKADRDADQKANEHGRNGGDPNKYRPKGLPKKY